MDIRDIVEEARLQAGISYVGYDIINSSFNTLGKQAITEYAFFVIQACINHLESKGKSDWQINYHGGWKGAIEELKELQRLK
jgi:hypothetical protein